MFLSLDGVDGVGKSTQLRLLGDWLSGRGIDVVTCRDPGSTPLGEAIREILLRGGEMSIHRRSEMLLYMAARAQLVEEVIRPALTAGKTVLSDRFLLANVVYQGHAGGMDAETLWRIGEVATGGLFPDLTLLLDLPAPEAALRIGRTPDRIESQGLDYLTRVQQGFLTEARRADRKVVIIDARPDVDQVQRQLRRAVSAAFGWTE